MLADSQDRPVRLGTRLGGGGEGEVYEAAGSDAAKIYAQAERTAERQAKLEVMIAHAPEDPTRDLGHATLAWPRDLLFDDAFVGFLMPRVEPGCPKLTRFIHPSLYPDLFSWRHQIEIAANLAGGLAALHAAGYVVGDLKGENVHVTPSCLVTFVDCDSIQLRDPATGRVFRCPKGTPEYTAPELQGVDFRTVDRTESSDAFALAIMICQLLMAGTHPFAGGRGPTREENISRSESFLLGGRPPLTSPPSSVIPPEVRTLLTACFRNRPKDRPAVREIAEALAASRERIILCQRRPDHHAYGDHLASCPWCEYEQRVGIDPYGPKPKPAPRPQRPAAPWVSAPSAPPVSRPPARAAVTPPRPPLPARTKGLAALLMALVLVYIATRIPPRMHAGEPPPPPEPQTQKAEIRVTPSEVDRLQTIAENNMRRVSEFSEAERREGLDTAVLRDAALEDLIFVPVGQFEMSSYETPNHAYAQCVEAKACRAPMSRGDLKDLGKRFHPVVGISWQDADTFCRWIGGRLPTETEWNVADVGPPAAGVTGLAPVESGPQNRLGLYGLAGNVKEWVAADTADKNGLRVLRGAARETAPAGSRSPEIGFRCARSR
ncbi:MAG TPA: SUMF1/EgtB/PvdO family nonheme iron enzyme [Thermoanaerobaculia bacterium]|jgi:serine/threonine protein kinase|nr:SUMF1/EgtB/PvdO family nonheme iron enzyme [Thermoanaerobaculia bacterium]